MKLNILIFSIFLAFQACSPKATTNTAVASANEATETFIVAGNCNMCKKTIEGASKQAGASYANWDKENDKLTVKFDKTKTSVDAIQKSIAKYGYDNVKYKATNEAYEGLPACCHYDRMQ